MTYTNSSTDTYTESRAKEVTDKAFEDFKGLEIRGLITDERASKWRRDILYLLGKKVLNYFEIQFIKPFGTPTGLRYTIQSYGTIHRNDDSGGDDFFDIPKNTTVNFFVDLDRSKDNIKEVDEQLAKWGYGNGNSLGGELELLKVYSKNNFGLLKNKIE
jgi:Bacterial HORMA domain family 1